MLTCFPRSCQANATMPDIGRYLRPPYLENVARGLVARYIYRDYIYRIIA
jgi:hypothetical protein